MANANYFVHTLLRARDWQHRPEFDQVCDWWREGGRGVCALVGMGGAGKTAIVERFLRVLPHVTELEPDLPKDHTLNSPTQLLVFSFYKSPNASRLFSELAGWLKNEPPDESHSTVSDREILELSQAGPDRLLVLDGLEEVQDDGSRSGVFGQIKDGRLSDFVQRMALGLIPNMAALITTRFSIAELEEQLPSLYVVVPVEEISEESAVTLLQHRHVKGTYAELKRLVEDCGCHALTIDLVGGYIAEFANGDPQTPMRLQTTDELESTIADEPNARRRYVLRQEFRFARVAESYTQSLAANDPAALALLQRICLFRLGVEADTLASVFTGKGKERISGSDLAQLSTIQIKEKLRFLVEIGLLEAARSRCQIDIAETYTVHPAVRDGFVREMNSDERLRSHRAAREGLEALLEQPAQKVDSRRSLSVAPERQSGFPTDSATLDLLEEIITHAIAAGEIEEARHIYLNRIGGIRNLLWNVADYARGDRICRKLLKKMYEESNSSVASQTNIALLLSEHSLYLKYLGDLKASSRCLEHNVDICTKSENWGNASSGTDSLAGVDALRGRLKSALELANQSLDFARRTQPNQKPPEYHWAESYARRGLIKTLVGIVDESLRDFEGAHRNQRRDLREGRLFSLRGLNYALWLFLLGRHKKAIQQLKENEVICNRRFGPDNPWSQIGKVLGADVTRKQCDLRKTRGLLLDAQKWALKHDARELLCRSALSSARLEVAETNLCAGRDAVEAGLTIARDCGYGLYHIDLLLERARFHLFRGDPQAALDDIELAIDTGIPANEETGQPELLAATDDECGYAWGIVEGLHLRGEALLLQAAQTLGSESFEPAECGQLPSEVSELIAQAESCLNDAMARWHDLRDPEPTENNNFVHPKTGVEYNYKAAETYRILDDLSRGLLTTYPLRDITMKDFFISYNSSDKQWAEWIAWKLEEAGYTTVIQAWDFRAGGDFAMEMQKAATGTDRTIAVLSDNYLNAEFTQPEWGNAFARDPQGHERTLVPVRIARCKPTGLLTTRIYIDLVGLSEDEAGDKLIESLKDRGKLATSPAFPGAGDEQLTEPVTEHPPQSFPGRASTAVEVWQEKLDYFQQQEAITSDHAQKFSLKKLIEEAQKKIAELSANP